MFKDSLDTLLDDIQSKVNETAKKSDFEVHELFTENFMNKYTKFKNIDDFLVASECLKDGQIVFGDKLDSFTNANSHFQTFDDMQLEAYSLLLV